MQGRWGWEWGGTKQGEGRDWVKGGGVRDRAMQGRHRTGRGGTGQRRHRTGEGEGQCMSGTGQW